MTEPAGWAPTKFGALLLISQNGCSARRGSGEPTVVLRLADVSVTDGLSGGEYRKIELSNSQREKYALRRGDLLAIRVNGSRHLAGQVIGYDGPENFVFCDHFIRMRVAEGIDPSFIAHGFRTPGIRGQLEHKLVSSAGQHTVSQSTYANLEVPVPPLNEQRRIVAKIESLFARSRRAKEALDAIPALLDKLRQSILAAAFRGDLTADWRAQNPDVEPAEKLLERIRTERRHRWEQTQLAKMRAKGKEPKNDKWKAKYKEPLKINLRARADLPSGWAWSSVGELVGVQTGATPKRGTSEFYDGGAIPWVTSTVVNQDYVESAEQFVTEQALAKTNIKLFPPGTIVVAMYGEGKTRGKCAELRISTTTNQALAALRTDRSESALKDFLKIVLEHNYQTIRRKAGGGVQPNLNLTDIRAIPVPVPSLAEQTEIVRLVREHLGRVRATRNALTTQVSKSASLDRSILSRAFRGELVEQDPNDEPASVLLDRIRAAREVAKPVKKARRKRKAASKPSAPADEPSEAPKATRSGARQPRLPFKLADYDKDAICELVATALWGEGALDKEAAVRHVAGSLKADGYCDFKRLRKDGPLYAEVLAAIEAAVKSGQLDRPKRGHVRSVRTAAADYTKADWRLALISSLNGKPTDREDAIRAAADWARDHMGLAFKRLPAEGQILTALKSALTSAIRRGDIERIDAKHIRKR